MRKNLVLNDIRELNEVSNTRYLPFILMANSLCSTTLTYPK